MPYEKKLFVDDRSMHMSRSGFSFAGGALSATSGHKQSAWNKVFGKLPVTKEGVLKKVESLSRLAAIGSQIEPAVQVEPSIYLTKEDLDEIPYS